MEIHGDDLQLDSWSSVSNCMNGNVKQQVRYSWAPDLWFRCVRGNILGIRMIFKFSPQQIPSYTTNTNSHKSTPPTTRCEPTCKASNKNNSADGHKIDSSKNSSSNLDSSQQLRIQARRARQ